MYTIVYLKIVLIVIIYLNCLNIQSISFKLKQMNIFRQIIFGIESGNKTALFNLWRANEKLNANF